MKTLSFFTFMLFAFCSVNQLVAQRKVTHRIDGYIISQREDDNESSFKIQRESDLFDNKKHAGPCDAISMESPINFDSLYSISFTKEKISKLADLNTVIDVNLRCNSQGEIEYMEILVVRAGFDDQKDVDKNISEINIDEIKELDKILSENIYEIININCPDKNIFFINWHFRFRHLLQYTE